MKFLTICEGGNVRSVALAFLLKNYCNQDAIAIGWRYASSDTMRKMCQWADRIIVMQEAFSSKVPIQFMDKVRVVDVGPDRWGVSMHPELMEFLEPIVKDWEKRKFDI